MDDGFIKRIKLKLTIRETSISRHYEGPNWTPRNRSAMRYEGFQGRYDTGRLIMGRLTNNSYTHDCCSFSSLHCLLPASCARYIIKSSPPLNSRITFNSLILTIQLCFWSVVLLVDPSTKTKQPFGIVLVDDDISHMKKSRILIIEKLYNYWNVHQKNNILAKRQHRKTLTIQIVAATIRTESVFWIS